MSKAGPYTKPGRLADVLALIQVLALDEFLRRTEDGITKELQGRPVSAGSWYEIGQEHREFFRVDPDAKSGLSLVARYVLTDVASGERPRIEPAFVSTLLQTAITLHEKETNAADKWKAFMPLWSALAAGALALAGAWIGGSHH